MPNYKMPPSSFLSPICLLHSFTSTLDDVHQDEPPFSKVFENHRKSLIRHYERSGQTVLPDRSLLIRQKLVKSAKIKKIRSDILDDLRSNRVTRQVTFNRTKIVQKCQNSNDLFSVIFKHCGQSWWSKMRHFCDFQPNDEKSRRICYATKL